MSSGQQTLIKNETPPEQKRKKVQQRVDGDLQIGYRVMCKWRDGKYRKAQIIEKRVKSVPEMKPQASDSKEEVQYYVHYLEFNRRMDEWVHHDRLDLKTVEIETQSDNSVEEKPIDPEIDGMKTRSCLKRRSEDPQGLDADEKMEFDEKTLREHEENTKVKNIESIELGRYEIETWYYSPLPKEYENCKKLFFCEFTLQFFKHRRTLIRHLRKLRFRHPPGDEIYRKDNVIVFEVDGRKEGIYCQNLCYLSKMFLDHKTLYYDVDLFLFYIMCELDDRGAHIVGYFSKEKHSEEGYNLACILTLPPYQRKGYGKFLISLSYELSKIERKVGTPERPLSDLGLVSYRQYWSRTLLKVIADIEEPVSLNDLSEMLAMKVDDVISTLQRLNMLHYKKGQHVIYAPKELIDVRLQEAGSPGLEVDPDLIIWVPYDARAEYASFRS